MHCSTTLSESLGQRLTYDRRRRRLVAIWSRQRSSRSHTHPFRVGLEARVLPYLQRRGRCHSTSRWPDTQVRKVIVLICHHRRARWEEATLTAQRLSVGAEFSRAPSVVWTRQKCLRSRNILLTPIRSTPASGVRPLLQLRLHMRTRWRARDVRTTTRRHRSTLRTRRIRSGLSSDLRLWSPQIRTSRRATTGKLSHPRRRRLQVGYLCAS